MYTKSRYESRFWEFQDRSLRGFWWWQRAFVPPFWGTWKWSLMRFYGADIQSSTRELFRSRRSCVSLSKAKWASQNLESLKGSRPGGKKWNWFLGLELFRGFFLTLTKLFVEQQSQHTQLKLFFLFSIFHMSGRKLFGILQVVGWKAGVCFVYSGLPRQCGEHFRRQRFGHCGHRSM